VVGAESTGKTALAQALAQRLAQDTGLAATWVPEHLRAWCQAQGRTPRVDEQRGIAQAQQQHIASACATHALVVCDTTALMTAVYSQWVFGDRSLHDWAAQQHAACTRLTLLTALDLPWVADGLQRTGPQVQAPVDDLLRGLLLQHRLPFALVGGRGAARLEAAVDAVAPLLRGLALPRQGLFTRLAQRNAGAHARAWRCERCDDPACEHALRQPHP
jgi:nicotinamide riboside kinase